MLFLLRSDQELGIKREAEAVVEEVKTEPDVKVELPEAPEEAAPPAKKKKKGRGKGNHNTNKIFINDINKASNDYMYLEDKKIVENTERILCIDLKSETGCDPETKDILKTTLRQYLHTNLESVCNSIQDRRVNVNTPLNTSTFNRDYRALNMVTPGMVYVDISKSAQRTREAADAAGDGPIPHSTSPVPQPGMMDGGLYYDDGLQQQQQYYQQEYEDRTTKKSKRGRKEGKFKRFL